MAGPAVKRELSSRGFFEAEDGEGDLARVADGMMWLNGSEKQETKSERSASRRALERLKGCNWGPDILFGNGKTRVYIFINLA